LPPSADVGNLRSGRQAIFHVRRLHVGESSELEIEIVRPEGTLKDDMFASQGGEGVSIGRAGVTATWKVPLVKAFGGDLIAITLTLASDIPIHIAVQLIADWIMDKFRGRSEKIFINRKEVTFDHGDLTKILQETITYERS
jgi:hypothetical protein